MRSRVGFPFVLAALVYVPAALGQSGVHASLSTALRASLLPHIPQPLYEKREDWGRTIEAAEHIHFEGKGLDAKLKVVKKQKNHGVWKHTLVTAPNAAQTLQVTVQNLQQPVPGSTTFDVVMTLPAEIEYEQQNWERGLRLYSGRVKARLRVSLNLTCEMTTRFEMRNGLLPEMVLALRVLHSNTAYDQLVVEHLPGVGGTAAQVLGEVVVKSMKQLHPSLERNLLGRLDAAIVKAASDKELHVGLAGLSRRGK